jgi:hypothetical protein
MPMPSSHASQPSSPVRAPVQNSVPALALGEPALMRISKYDDIMTWPADAQLPCPMCGCTTEGLLERGSLSARGGILVRTEALPCGCDVTAQAQPLQAAAVHAGYLTMD